MTSATALRLGYEVTERTILGGSTRWFCAPRGTHFATTYGKPFATEAEALAEVLARVAYSLKVSTAEVLAHLAPLVARG